MSIFSNESANVGGYGQDFHVFLARLPRILGLLESMSTSQQRLETKLDSISSMLFEGRPEVPVVHGSTSLEEDAVAATPHRLATPKGKIVTHSTGTNRASTATATDWEIAEKDDRDSPPELASEASCSAAFMLPENWPASLAPRNKTESTSSKSFVLQGGLSSKTFTRNSKFLARWSTQRDLSDKERTRPCPGFCSSTALVLSPTSPLLAAWSILGAIVFMLDLTTIPYILAWDVPYDGGVLFWLTWCFVLFWSMDILVNFRTGFYDKAELVLQPGKVAISYLTSWFLMDFFVVCCDWLAMLLSTADDDGVNLRLARLGKVGRLLRVASLLRVYRFSQVVEKSLKSFKIQEYLPFRVLQLVFYVLLFNHVMSCAWYAIGTTAHTDTGNRWVELQNFPPGQPLYEYLSALHWTVAQFTLGSMDINCTNSAERAFSIFFLILGLIISTIIISSLSAAAVDFQISRAEEVKKVNQMTQFFRENYIDRRVTQQVHEQVRERLRQQETLLYNDVEAFRVLSTGVRRDLQFELCKRHFKSHGLFRLWGHLDQAVAREICDTATKYEVIRRMDDLFMPGTVAKSAYHLVSGTVRYTQNPQSAPVAEEKVTVVSEGKWVSEAAVWSYWIHVGQAHATTECQLLVLNGDALAQALHTGFVARQVTLEYSRQFYRNLIAACPPKRQWPNDLWVPFTDYGSLVWCMSPDVQVVIGLDAIEDVFGMRRLKTLRPWLEEMVQEVHNGTSVVVVSANGELERLVSVVTMRLRDRNGKTLIHVATLEENGNVTPHAYLPGVKLVNGEQPEEGLKRLIEDRLPLLEGHWSLLRVEREIEIRKSPRYGVQTKYLKTVFHARLTGRFEYESKHARRPMPYRPTTSSMVDHGEPGSPLGPLSTPTNQILGSHLPEEGRQLSRNTTSVSSDGSFPPVPRRTSEGMHARDNAYSVQYHLPRGTTVSFARPKSRVSDKLSFDTYVIPKGSSGVGDKHGLYGWLSEAELGALKKMSDSTMRALLRQAVQQCRLSC